MIFYLSIDESGRRCLVSTQAEARSINSDFEQMDIPTSKEELRQFVQNLYDLPEPPAPSAREPSYSEASVSIDEIFDNLPLARQLHFAALAMENARVKLK